MVLALQYKSENAGFAEKNGSFRVGYTLITRPASVEFSRF
jgi:hypothetical protein